MIATFVLALASTIIARLLGPDNYGLYPASFDHPPSFLLLFADFSVNSTLIKYLAQFRVNLVNLFVDVPLSLPLTMSYGVCCICDGQFLQVMLD